MKTKRIVVALLGISLALTAWLVFGSFVTYAPSVSATKIQNIYIARNVRMGLLIGVLQAAAMIVVLVDQRISRN
jgi:hypothetical protein